jgi:hypothetical protein
MYRFDDLACTIIDERYSIAHLTPIIYIILLCGLWDQLHTTFHYITVPALQDDHWVSRTNELMVDDRFTLKQSSDLVFIRSPRPYHMKPILPPPAQNGDVVIRKCVVPNRFTYSTPNEFSKAFIINQISIRQSYSGIITRIVSHYTKALQFSILITRLNALDHVHEDPTQARACGRLRLGLHPFFISQPGGFVTRPLSILNREGSSSEHAYKERSTPRVFSS